MTDASDNTPDPSEPVQLSLPGIVTPDIIIQKWVNANKARTQVIVHQASTLSTNLYSTLGAVSYYPSATTPIPDEGIKLGEIEAWRCWRVRDNQLYSTASTMHQGGRWPPGEILTAEMSAESIGIHAWKEQKNAVRYLDDLCSYCPAEPLAIGRVHLWGRIVEHELGYLAEHARIISVEGIHGAYPDTLQIVQDKYALPHTPSLDIEKMIKEDMGVLHRGKSYFSRLNMLTFITSAALALINTCFAAINYVYDGSDFSFTMHIIAVAVCLNINRVTWRHL